MSINCSEKCIHQENGICTLTHVINSTGEVYNDCPYFKSREDNYTAKAKKHS